MNQFATYLGLGCSVPRQDPYGIELEGTASTSLALGGALTVTASDVNVNGDFSIDPFVVKVFVRAAFFGIKCEKQIYDSTLSEKVEKTTGDFIIYTF